MRLADADLHGSNKFVSSSPVLCRCRNRGRQWRIDELLKLRTQLPFYVNLLLLSLLFYRLLDIVVPLIVPVQHVYRVALVLRLQEFVALFVFGVVEYFAQLVFLHLECKV